MRSTETDIARAAMTYLETTPNGEATIRAVKANLPKFRRLSSQDLAASPTRRNESVWEQQVRNIVSHRNSPGNFIADGLLTRRPRRLAITPLGRRRLARTP
jgi:hypothetical protein